MTTKRTAELGISKNGEDLRCELRQKPCDNSVSDRCPINIAPFQLGQDVLCVHSTRFDEAQFYLDARDLKSACLG
jgi:hypothetical protein